jgi:NAD-dependent dihydropyrimidine dehydrogenase PreA subunit
VSDLHGVFIRVDVEPPACDDADLARKLEEACPVDIFAARDGRVEVVEENLDECVLCELCLDAAPPGAVRVVKLYDGGAALERSA